MKHLLLVTVIFLFINPAISQIAKPSAGKIARIENFKSEYVTPRNIDVWLPENFDRTKKYNVLYMHDGQTLFDSTNAGNKTSLEVDVIITKLMNENRLKDVIVVGIWSKETTRHSDYFPEKPFNLLSKQKQDSILQLKHPNGDYVFANQKINSDNYLKFMVKELKPYIDKKFAVDTDKKSTLVMGSSMGGLISLYAICEYPEVFGGAACLSTNWSGLSTLENNPIPDAFLQYIRQNLPNPRTHRIYFDYGTATLDSLYSGIQLQVDKLMLQKKFEPDNWITLEFPGDDHTEIAWKRRLDVPLLFLLQK
jgi:predicted alpha/beta superfamily hydrolase